MLELENEVSASCMETSLLFDIENRFQIVFEDDEVESLNADQLTLLVKQKTDSLCISVENTILNLISESLKIKPESIDKSLNLIELFKRNKSI